MRVVLDYITLLRHFNRNARLFLLHTLLSSLGMALLILLYNLYILSLGFKQDTIGFLTMLASLAAVLSALPMALVLHRLGYRAAMSLGAAGSALSMALVIAVPTLEAFVVAELTWGLAFTLLVIGGGPFMTDNSSEETRSHLFSMQFVMITATAFLGNLFGGELPRLLGGLLGAAAESPLAYQAAIAVFVVLMLLSIVPVQFFRPVRTGSAAGARPRLAVRQPRKVAALLAPNVIGTLGAAMFIPFANVLWKFLFGLNDAAIGVVFAVSALMMTAAGMLAPALSRRWGLLRMMVLAQLVSAGGMLVFGFSPWLGVALGGFFARDVMTNLFRPFYGQFLMERSEPTERATVSSLSSLGFNLAWAISSWVSGTWQAAGQYSYVFLSGAALYLVSVLLLRRLAGVQTAPAGDERVALAAPAPVSQPAE